MGDSCPLSRTPALRSYGRAPQQGSWLTCCLHVCTVHPLIVLDLVCFYRGCGCCVGSKLAFSLPFHRGAHMHQAMSTLRCAVTCVVAGVIGTPALLNTAHPQPPLIVFHCSTCVSLVYVLGPWMPRAPSHVGGVARVLPWTRGSASAQDFAWLCRALAIPPAGRGAAGSQNPCAGS